MIGAHLHLLVNHTPILGALFALALLVASFLYAPEVLRRTTFAVLIFTGIAAAVTNLSGDPAAEVVRGLPGVRQQFIEHHSDMGDVAAIAAGIVGVLAIGALLRWRRRPIPPAGAYTALAVTAVLSAIMVYTGLLGGRIRHTEVRPGATKADAMAVEHERPRSSSQPR